MSEEKRERSRQYVRCWRAAKCVNNTEVNHPELVAGCQTDSEDALGSVEEYHYITKKVTL